MFGVAWVGRVVRGVEESLRSTARSAPSTMLRMVPLPRERGRIKVADGLDG